MRRSTTRATYPCGRRALRAWTATTLGLAVAITAPVVRADAESDAKDLFAKGRDLRERNDCATAAPLFRKAWTIYPQGLGSLRNLAECEEVLGHFASARRAWLDLSRALITAPNDAKYLDWDHDAETAAKRLQPKVATFVVDIIVRSPKGEAPATEQSGVELFVNGEELKGTLIGTPLERDPGTYAIRAQAKDAAPATQRIELRAGDNPHVTLALAVTPKEPAVVTTEDHGSHRTLGWIALGAGAAALVGGGITLGLRQGALGEVEDRCGEAKKSCDPSLRDTVDRGQTMSTLTSILLPVGAIGVGAGLVLVFTSSTARGASGTRGPTTVRVAPSLGGIDVTGRF